MQDESPDPEEQDQPYYRQRPERANSGCLDYLITHVTMVLVLGTVALGGSEVVRILSHLRLTGGWAVVVGAVLVLAYLAVVGFVILVVGGIGQSLLNWLNRNM